MFQKTLSSILIILLTHVGFIPPHLSYAQENNEYTIAVLDLDAKGISQVEADYLSEYMRGQVTRQVNSDEYKKRAGLIFKSSFTCEIPTSSYLPIC